MSDKQTEALKLAQDWYDSGHEDPDEFTAMIKEVIALAEQPAQQQEPVANASAWFALVMNAAAELEDASNCLRDEDAKRVAIRGAKYYRNAANALYTSPPASKPWVGLTDEQERELAAIASRDAIYAIETTLRENNNG